MTSKYRILNKGSRTGSVIPSFLSLQDPDSQTLCHLQQHDPD
jgi:hypothetical protein